MLYRADKSFEAVSREAEDQAVAEFVARHTDGNERPSNWGSSFKTIGFVEGRTLIAGVVFYAYSGFDVFISVASVKPSWASRRAFRLIAEKAFKELGCVRVSAVVSASNHRVQKLLRGVGFGLEGTRRLACYGTEDMLLFGMLRKECRWLGELPH